MDARELGWGTEIPAEPLQLPQGPDLMLLSLHTSPEAAPTAAAPSPAFPKASAERRACNPRSSWQSQRRSFLEPAHKASGSQTELVLLAASSCSQSKPLICISLTSCKSLVVKGCI